MLRVDYQLSREGNRTALKTAESRRAIDVSADLKKHLLELPERHGSLFTPTAFIFQSRNGNRLERKVCRAAHQRAEDPPVHELAS